MSSLLEKMKLGAENTKDIEWPGTKEKVTMRIASEYDKSLATVAADRYFKERDIITANVQSYIDYAKIYRLYLILIDPETKQKINKTFNEFYALITEDIVLELELARLDFQNECSPDPDLLTPEQLKAQYEEVKKKGYYQVISLISNINIVHQLGDYMASLLLDSQPAN